MKKKLTLLAVVTAMVFFLSCSNSSDRKFPHTISASGRGLVEKEPDFVQVSLAVVTEDKAHAKAQEQNMKDSDAVVLALKEAGVKEENITTLNYTLGESRHYDSAGRIYVRDGYRASHDVSVKITDTGNVPNVLNSAIDSGTVTIKSMSYGIENYTEYQNQALEKAMAAAHEQAVRILSGSGSLPGSALHVTTSLSGTPRPVQNSGFMRGYAEETKAASADSLLQSFSNGTRYISAEVYVEYEIVNK